MSKKTFKLIQSAEDEADLTQASLMPKPHDTLDLTPIIYNVTEIHFAKSTFNLQTGSTVIILRARRWRGCFYGWNYTYSLQNPTWDGKALGLTIYDVENHRHVQLQFLVKFEMNPQVDSLFSSTPALE